MGREQANVCGSLDLAEEDPNQGRRRSMFVNHAFSLGPMKNPGDSRPWQSARVRHGKALANVWQKIMRPNRLFLLSYKLQRSTGHKLFDSPQSFLVLLLLLAACASPPERVLSSNVPSYATLPNGYEPLNPTQPSPIYAAATAIPGDNVVRYLERKRGHALNILSLSGGGQNGAGACCRAEPALAAAPSRERRHKSRGRRGRWP